MSARIVLLIALLLPLTGCGREKLPSTQAVTGVVTLDGKPLEGANVVLVPSDPKTKSAGAVTDSQGNFSVKTYWNAEHQLDGALPGEYGITITKQEKREAPPNMKPEEFMAQYMKLGPPKSLVPKKYGDVATSGFKVSVGKSPPAPLKLDLQ